MLFRTALSTALLVGGVACIKLDLILDINHLNEESCTKTKPDGVVGPHANPMRDGAVLPQLLSQFLLDPEGLLGRLQDKP